MDVDSLQHFENVAGHFGGCRAGEQFLPVELLFGHLDIAHAVFGNVFANAQKCPVQSVHLYSNGKEGPHVQASGKVQAHAGEKVGKVVAFNGSLP